METTLRKIITIFAFLLISLRKFYMNKLQMPLTLVLENIVRIARFVVIVVIVSFSAVFVIVFDFAEFPIGFVRPYLIKRSKSG